MGILTEEELKEISESITGMTIGVMWDKVDEIIASHRELLAANAELSFKNNKLTESLKKVDDHLQGVMHPERLVMLDCPWMHKTLSQTLEELK